MIMRQKTYVAYTESYFSGSMTLNVFLSYEPTENYFNYFLSYKKTVWNQRSIVAENSNVAIAPLGWSCQNLNVKTFR